jgi:L-seryl-tRNA(Ser) seleniumtransferase
MRARRVRSPCASATSRRCTWTGSRVDRVPSDRRRAIPSTDALLGSDALAGAVEELGREHVRHVVRRAQQLARDGAIDPAAIETTVIGDLPLRARSIARVINATGVIVHTNLGRAPLSVAAQEAMLEAAGYSAVELDLRTGERAGRGRHVLDLLTAMVPGAEAALLVNNNAAALVLATMALASDREVVISKGELVEIGDGFRIAEMLRAAGARLREVGSTNRTTLADYADVVSSDTGFVIKVHRANFAISGYHGEVSVAELAGLPSPVVVDIGSGLLRPDQSLPDEPDASSALQAGADLVTASADKLLGGPQAGIVLGRSDLIERLRRHPVARAVRVDKITLAALEATLRDLSPVRRMIIETYEIVRARAQRLSDALRAHGMLATEVVDTVAAVGGGGAPAVRLPSAAVSLAERFAEPLRRGVPAVMGRVDHGRCLLDLRTVSDVELGELQAAVLTAHRAVELSS